MKNLVRESLTQSINEKVETEEISVYVRKGSGQNLVELLEYIKTNGNTGHSFEIVVDPELPENTKKFFWDGDGSDYIESVNLKK